MSRSNLPQKTRLLLFALAALVLCASSAGAQQAISGSAFGSGGTLTGGGLRLIGSAGQAATGIVSGAANIHRAGLYFQVATAPALSLSTTSLSFGDVQVGQTKPLTFTVSNTGAAVLTVSGITVSGADAAQFTVSPASFTINPGAAAQTVTVTFAPTSTGAKSASLSIAHNAAGSPSSVALSGGGTAQPPPPAPAISLSVTSLTMDNTGVGSTSQKTFTISNTGNASLSITGITVSGTDAALFTVSPTSFTVNAGASQTVTVTFAPSSAGVKSAALSVAHNAAGSPSSVALSGAGSSVDFSVTNTTGRGELTVRFTLTVQNAPIRSVRWTFGDGETSVDVHPEHLYRAAGVYTVRVDVTTEGGQVLTRTKEGFITVRHLPPDVNFSASATGGRTPLAVRFTSTNAGGGVTAYAWTFGDGEAVSAAQDTITHVYRAAGTYTVGLTATGPGGADTETKTGFITVSESQSVVAVSPPALSFGGVRACQSRALTFVVRNGGNVALSVSSISASGTEASQFAVSPASLTINAGDSARVTVTFTPTVGDTLSAVLSLAHNATGSPATVRVSGVGIKPTLAHRPDSLQFGDVALGAEVGLPLTLTNAGNDTLRLDSLTVASTPGAGIAATPQRLGRLLAPRDTQVVAVSLLPRDPGGLSGRITVFSSDPANPALSIPVSGTGVSLALSMDLNAADGNQRQGTAGGVRPGRRVSVQLFIENAPQVRGFTVRVTFDPRKIAFVRESFAAGPVVPGLLGLTDLKGDYVEVGGTTLGSGTGGTGGGSGLLGTLSFEALAGFEGETRLRIPFIIWDRGAGDRQTIRADVQAALTSTGGLPSPDFDGDREVGFNDFFLFANAFGSSDVRFDLDGDGNVGFTDFFLFADAFGKRVG
ncbi:MAG: hypothetical protein A3F84_23525 [Candidatus Handelsmanbacteria bacterium RIFCSPLOWO2_12_FULL_64_10]|uniref:PKD domain-containing protein n=1 Tax=Handelsmanbacteria sp. (strain RIFCSPLOWO2_12_FULL_64_10) TaxID=1817868 RepID=A0A1F6CRT5_HANXR|nr:MAG: hypothetical protein A3F84_23525 [Candidatus Handelsmanbacteria bacterium RIFCSPLOWO2_12_FULL_64_10]